MPQNHCDGLSKDEVYYGTPSLKEIDGYGDYKFLALVNESIGKVSVGVRHLGDREYRPDMTWLDFPSVEMFNIFLSACESLKKKLPPEKETNLFLFGYPNETYTGDRNREKESFDYEENECPIGKGY